MSDGDILRIRSFFVPGHPQLLNISLRDDTPIRLVCGNQEVAGVLVSFRDGDLVVSIEVDLGATISSARLVTDDSFLVERLKERLGKVSSGEIPFNKAAAERVVGEGGIQTGDIDPEPTVLLGDNPLNEEQRGAIRRSLGSDTVFVWGPPGTGKTTTLARVVEAHYRIGRSVLLVSNTNIAVDTALEKVAERLKGETDFYQGAVLRQGPVVKEELSQQFGPQVVLEKVVERLSDKVKKEKSRLQLQLAEHEEEERSLVQAVSSHESLAKTNQASSEVVASLAASQKSLRDRELGAGLRRIEVDSLRVELARAVSAGTLRRLLSGLNPDRIRSRITLAEREHQVALEAARALTEEIVKRETRVRELRRESEPLVRAVASHPPLAECRRRLNVVQKTLRPIRDRIGEIERELAALAEEILGRCRILATTVYRTYLGSQKPRLFDVVVIDEASMLMLPLVYYTAGLAKQAVVVAGDFRQLPSIVLSEEKVAQEWLKRDVFEKVGIPERVRRHSRTPELVSLQSQYRMREPICKVVNRFFYPDHPLITDPSTARIPHQFPLGDSPLLYVDTAPFHPWTALRLGSFSRYNLFHALLVRNIIVHLAEVGYLPGGEEPNDAVGAVAPYGAQAKLIQALLEDRLGSRAAGIAATVHRFQGNEKDAMVLDFTDSFGTRLGRFFTASQIEEDGARLLNVAVSRARHHVVVVANFEYLNTHAPENAIVRRLLGHFKEHGEALDVEALLPLADHDWVDALHHVAPHTFELPNNAAGAFNEETFYPAFTDDLMRAASSIVLFSPFASTRGTDRWGAALRTAIGRGVAVRVVMRPPGGSGSASTETVAEIGEALRGIGVSVDLRAEMHEKIAIIDGRILWHGSLNILSHRDTHESMLRIESKGACEAISHFVSTPTGRREDRPPLQASENPPCPVCSGPTVWINGREGIFFTCAEKSCGGKVDSRHGGRRPPRSGAGRRGGERTTRPAGVRPCPQPGCTGHLVERNGRYGQFLGCTDYPRCRYAEDKK